MQKPTLQRDWRSRAERLLGVVSDVEIGRQFGVSDSSVRRLRVKLGLPAAYSVKWRADVIKRLGVDKDSSIARDMGISVSAVKLKRREFEGRYERRGMPPAAARDLGVLTDMEVALKYGRGYDTARSWRVEQGIPPVVKQRRWSAQEVALLGALPDIQLGRQIGRRASHVRVKRVALGIPEYAPSAAQKTA